ncbi:hypothetical protein [Spiroplasma endosymbiont of Diplazon laetatorius]|uniref:hypothetical protein n=1 Tax=Spiroplasma endosymbiont of Diplazon laetatorius TaxID=3066322 RepID=UPI0030D14A73
MKNFLKIIASFNLFVLPLFSVVSCTTRNNLESKINKIIKHREIPTDYRYLNNWNELLISNSLYLNNYNMEYNWAVKLEAEKWFMEENENLKNYLTPKETKIIEGDDYNDKILIDLEFPYSNDPKVPFSGSTVIASTLMEEEFLQIYNYKNLVNLGYEIKVESSNKDVINVISQPDENGVFFFKGTKEQGDAILKIEANPKSLNQNLPTLNNEIKVYNRSNKDNGFLQWRTYQYVKYVYSKTDSFTLLVACYLVQIYSQMMYNASYNTNPNISGKMPLLDEKMIDMLYCASEYNMFINYLEFWPAADSPIGGYGFYFSFNFYVHPSYKSGTGKALQSSPLAEINPLLKDFSKETFNLYNDLKGEEK